MNTVHPKNRILKTSPPLPKNTFIVVAVDYLFYFILFYFFLHDLVNVCFHHAWQIAAIDSTFGSIQRVKKLCNPFGPLRIGLQLMARRQIHEEHLL